MRMKLGEEVVNAFRAVDRRDLSLLIPISRRVMATTPNWLDNKKNIAEVFKKAAAESTGLPSLKFEQYLPVFLKTVGKSRLTKTQYGEREIVTIEIIEPMTVKENPPGTRMTMWLTQEVFRTKLEAFRDTEGWLPGDLELCIVNLGKTKGKKFSYNDYFVGTAEQGRKKLEEVI